MQAHGRFATPSLTVTSISLSLMVIGLEDCDGNGKRMQKNPCIHPSNPNTKFSFAARRVELEKPQFDFWKGHYLPRPQMAPLV